VSDRDLNASSLHTETSETINQEKINY
jgi:hypothetical protein